MGNLPQLKLFLGTTESKGSVFYAGDGQRVSQFDSALGQHTITLFITEEEVGKVMIHNPNARSKAPAVIELPTYKMVVTDTLTEERRTYEVTRDFVMPEAGNRKKQSLWSLLTFTFMRERYVYPVLTYEPLLQEIETYCISRHRSLKEDRVSYSFRNGNKVISLFAGNFDQWEKPKNLESLFLVVDGNKGNRFVGDILYREKFLKLTPAVELRIIRRKKTPKTIEFNKNGNIQKIIYL
ncbi:MAG TPA: hypothetical protein VIU12_28925 [Chryseolinea sp.]